MGFLAAALSTSRRRVRREWSLQDYFEQIEFWQLLPPQNVSLALIARAHGAKFTGTTSERPSPQPEVETDPQSLLGFFGQAEPLPYRPPQRGLVIDPGGNA